MAQTPETDEQQYQYKCPVMGGATCLEEDCGFLNDDIGLYATYDENGCPIANAFLRVRYTFDAIEDFRKAFENIHHYEINRCEDGSVVDYGKEIRHGYMKEQQEKKGVNDEN